MDVGYAVAEIVSGATGLVVGIVEGILRGIYDALEGIVGLIGTIIDTIKSLITGALFDQIKKLYDAIANLKDLTHQQLKEFFYAVLGNIGNAIKDIIENWNNASAFEKGRVIGIVIGAIILEIVIAVFSGGTASAAKWAGKLGKFGKVISKVGKLGDDLRDGLKKNKDLKKLFKKGEYENEPDKDASNWQRWALLQQARVTAKTLDTNGASERELFLALNAQARLYPKLKVHWEKKDKKVESFDLWMKASKEKKVVDDFTSGKSESLVDLDDRFEFTNKSNQKLRWKKQTSDDILNSIKSKLKSSNDGDIAEGIVGDFLHKNKIEIEAFGQKRIRDKDGSVGAELDVVTKKHIIEIKNSIVVAKSKFVMTNRKGKPGQAAKLVKSQIDDFSNPKNKKVILYINKELPKTPEGKLFSSDKAYIDNLKTEGIEVVNSLEDLLKIIE